MYNALVMKQLLFIVFLCAYGFNVLNAQNCPTNIDFESGNFSNWTLYTGSCCPISTPTNSGAVTNRHTITSGTGVDPYGGFPIVAPSGGNYSLKLGNNSIGAQAERATYKVQFEKLPLSKSIFVGQLCAFRTLNP